MLKHCSGGALVLGALLSLLVCAQPASAAFNETTLLDNGPSGTYSCFKQILAKSEVDNQFYESEDFMGSFLAFTDEACSNFASNYGFNDTEEFLNSEYASEYATEMINLHILPDLETNTTSDSPYLVAANNTGFVFVKVLTNSNGEPKSFVYPTLAYPPEETSEGSEISEESESSEATGDEETGDEDEETGGEDDETGDEDDGSRRKLLSKHSVDILDRVKNPSDTKQVFYIDEVLVPVTLINELVSRNAKTAYDAIAATPTLSMFKTIIDQDIEGITELRNKLNSANYSGTVFCPHDDAFHTLFSALNTSAGDFAEQFPSILTQMVEYHILPFAFNVTELTKPGNGIKDKGRERKGIPPGRGRGNRGGSDNERGPGRGGGDDDEDDDSEGEGNGNGNGNGNGIGRKLLQRAENRFQTNRPGPRFDLNVIKNGEGRVFIRGKRTSADLLTPESQIVVSGDDGNQVFMHIIDDVLRFSNIATDKSAQALFGAGSSVKPEGQSFEGVADALARLNRLNANGELDLNGTTFIAPSDNALEQLATTQGTTVEELLSDREEFLEDLLDAHTVKFGPNDVLLDGDIIETMLEGTNVQYSIDDAGNESFSLTSEEATFTSSGSRRRLLNTASVSSTTTISDGQIMYTDGTLSTGDGSTDGAWQAAPGMAALLLAALLAALL